MLKLYPKSTTDIALTLISAGIELVLLIKLARRRGWTFTPQG